MGGEQWTGSVHFIQIHGNFHARETAVPTAEPRSSQPQLSQGAPRGPLPHIPRPLAQPRAAQQDAFSLFFFLLLLLLSF